jgi:hypothetical protein
VASSKAASEAPTAKKSIADELADIQVRAQEAALNRGDLGTPPMSPGSVGSGGSDGGLEMGGALDASLFTHEQALEFDEHGDIIPAPAGNFVDVSDIRDDGKPVNAPDPADIVLALRPMLPAVTTYTDGGDGTDDGPRSIGATLHEQQQIDQEQGSIFDLIDSSLKKTEEVAHAVANRLVALAIRRAVRRKLRLLRTNRDSGDDCAQLADIASHAVLSRQEVLEKSARVQATHILRVGTKRFLKAHHPEFETMTGVDRANPALPLPVGVVGGVSEMASQVAAEAAHAARAYAEEAQQAELARTVQEVDVALHSSQLKRRGNVMMSHVQQGQGGADGDKAHLAEGGTIAVTAEATAEELKVARMNMLYKSRQVQAMVQCISFESFSTGPIPERVFPARPYLHARVAGQEGRANAWIGETPPLWVAHSFLPGDQQEFSWPTLGFDDVNKGFPVWFKVRVFQDIIFEVLDAGSGLLVGQLRVGFDELMTQERNADNIATFFCDLQYSPNYGGGIAKGSIRFIVDTREEAFKLPPMPEDYWDHHQSQHWATYPITPISTGVVRQQFREVAGEYDRMMVVNPVFYGFSVRFKGRNKFECHFLHPMFTGYQMLRKPLSLKKMQAMELEAAKKIKPNPFKYVVVAPTVPCI